MSIDPANPTISVSRHAATEPRWFEPIVEFAGHILGGTTIFLLIAGAGWILHKATVAVGTDNIVLHFGLSTGEIVVFAADSLLFILFVIRTFWRAARKLVRDFNE
jgi:hypothetical protein